MSGVVEVLDIVYCGSSWASSVFFARAFGPTSNEERKFLIACFFDYFFMVFIYDNVAIRHILGGLLGMRVKVFSWIYRLQKVKFLLRFFL